MASYILSIDQGTSSTKTLIFDENAQIVARASEPLPSLHFDGGFVEQDPEVIFQNVLQSIAKCLASFAGKGLNTTDIKSCGISNQRETFVVWDENGAPIHNAVVWQCKRSIGVCNRLKEEGLQELIKEKTGLIIDPYFSASKLIWLNENNEKISEAIEHHQAYFGTIDTWLLYKFTNGDVYLTDHTNASRTMFFNLANLDWDEELIDRLGLRGINLPAVKPSSFHYGDTNFFGLLNHEVPINAMIGDSHSAAFGEGCIAPGTAKATLGTGCSVMMNIGSELKSSDKGMVTTICWSTEERVDYALEGVIVTCGATIEWLKNQLNLFADSAETEKMATSIADNGGVYLIPAFSGLGAPHWDMSRKASISGLSFDSRKEHIVRAALESIPYQIKDVIAAMEDDAAIILKELNVDGGISNNEFVVQFLSDLLEKPVVNIGIADVSALGAALLAGLKSGIFTDISSLRGLHPDIRETKPGADTEKVKGWYKGWTKTIAGQA